MIAGRRGRLRLALLGGLVGAVAIGVVEGLYWWRHVTVTDAWVDADVIVLTSPVNGTVQRIDARKGDLVKRGDLLIAMDADVAALDVASVEADLAKAKAERAAVAAELRAYRQDVDDRIRTHQDLLELEAREAATLQRRLDIASDTVARNATLYKSQAIAKRLDDEARDRRFAIMSELREIETDMAERRRQVVELEGSRVREEIYASRIAVIDRTVDVLSVRLARARTELEKMHVYAPTDAVVNEVYVSEGEYVEDADRTLLLHDPSRIWVEAPVDDAVVRHIALGQPVEIDVDAYPYDTFHGQVAAIGRVTVATIEGGGEAARQTPRVPVIVELEASPKPLWPGIRATASIRIR